METQLITRLHRDFEDYAHMQDGVEFWYARELQVLLGYDHWKNFDKIIAKAKQACQASKQEPSDHFAGVGKMVKVGSGAEREVSDYMLTRYACYLLAQNGDPQKDEIAFAMTYFAVQTRKQEVLEQRLKEWERLQAREKLSLSEKELSGLVFERGVDGQGFARIRSKGDQALFGGHNTQAMKEKLNVLAKRPLADFLPTVTIKAKDLANEITSFNLEKDKSLEGETLIGSEHIKNNQHMREMLAKSGIQPETLPPAEDIKKLGRKLKSQDQKLLKGSKKLQN